jgi:hypothetical protein
MFRDELHEVLMQVKICLTKVTDMNSMLLSQKLTNAVLLYEAKIKNIRERTISLKNLFTKLNASTSTQMDLKSCFVKVDECDLVFMQFKQ